MVQVPTGISGLEVTIILAQIRANGEIANIPPPQLDPILARAKKDLTELAGPPPPPPPTP